MDEVRHDMDDLSQTKSVFESKRFLIATVLLVISIAGIEIFNMFQTYYEAAASLTYLYGFIHIVFEWYQALINILILFGLVSFCINQRKKTKEPSKGLSLIVTVLWIHLFINAFIFSIYLATLGSLTFLAIGVLFVFGYRIVMIKYLADWIRHLKKRSKKAPNPLWITIFVIGLSLFLIFHYFYMQFGGDYGIRAYRPLYFVNTPFMKIALMLLLQVALIFVISTIHTSTINKKKIRLIPMIMAGMALITITLMGFIESSIPHYRYNVFESESNTQLEIQISNGFSSITPIGFYDILDDGQVDVQHLDDYMTRYDYDLMANLGQIPSIDANIITTMSMAKNTLVGSVYVYDINHELITGIHDWYQLDELGAGTYFIVAKLSVMGDPSFEYGDYLFILNVK